MARIVKYVVLVICFTWLEINVARYIHSKNNPAGLTTGIVDGILMPTTLPALLFGKDMVIYAESNTGRTYKLGYTLGVNGCGAVFFGILFWRVTRWHRSRTEQEISGPLKAGSRSVKAHSVVS